MQEKKVVFGRLLFVICFSIAFYICLSRINIIFSFIMQGFKVMKPVFIGMIIAFIVNIPMSFIEKCIYVLFSKNGKNKTSKMTKERTIRESKVKKINRKREKLIRTISLIITLGILFLCVRGLITFIIPQLVDTIQSIIKNVPVYLEELKNLAYFIRDKFAIPHEVIEKIILTIYEKANDFTSNIADIFPQVIKTTQNITSGMFDLVMSLIISIYILTSKERLGRMVKKIIYAMSNQKYADKTIKVITLANKTFTAFAKGQILEACIIGLLCYVGMLAFRLEYSLLISVIIGVSALIPIFGAFIGGAVGTLLLFTIAPIKGLWFLIFLIVLQQIEGNFIYPKVVGTSIGISGLWVLIALIIGSEIAGIPGILIGIPSFATVYELFGEYINNKLENKKIEVE